MNKKLAVIIVVVLLLVGGGLVLANGGSKSSGSAKSTADSSSAVATQSVMIKNYMFGPMAIKVKVGQKVTWTNTDAVSHTITADTASSDAPSSMDIAKGETYSFTFNKAGTYTYHCFPHPYMHGTVIVTN